LELMSNAETMRFTDRSAMALTFVIQPAL